LGFGKLVTVSRLVGRREGRVGPRIRPGIEAEASLRRLEGRVGHKSRPDSGPATRLAFLDEARGMIMVFMAWDHALYFWSSGRISNEGLPLFHQGSVLFNLPGAAPWLGFAAMLLSSLSAPGFLFITGYAMNLAVRRRRERGETEPAIDRHLWSRSILLMVVQLAVASPAFNLPLLLRGGREVYTIGTFLSFSVLSTIGLGYMALSFLRRLPSSFGLGLILAGFGLTQMQLSGLAKGFAASPLWLKVLLNLFLLPVPFSTGLLVNNNFPFVPWLLPLVLGWWFGDSFRPELGMPREGCRFAAFGVLFVLAFVLLRLGHVGDNLIFDGSLQGFFFLSKYPPSLDYILFYLGALLLMFAWLIFRPAGGVRTVLRRFGQAPLFFYCMHLWLFALVPALGSSFNRVSLLTGTGIWLLGLVVLYVLCDWYLDFRVWAEQRHHYA